MKKIKILGLICARSGSKGIKNKNIKIFNSKPLIYWTIKSAKKISLINKIYVSTDSKKIMSIANKFGAETPFLRPKKLAQDNSPEILSWRHALNFFYGKYKYLPNALVILPITSPTREINDVKKSIFVEVLEANALAILKKLFILSFFLISSFFIKLKRLS